MKLLFLGLVPVIIFWFVEEKFGTFWGLIAAMIWAVGECAFEYARNRRVDRLTLFSTALVVGLGGVGAWLDKSVLFKFQPVIVEIAFGGVLLWGGRKGEPLLFQMAQKTRPEVFSNQNPAAVEFQKNLMAKMTRHLIVILILHSLLLSYMALYGTTGQWAFWKGVGFNVFLGVWGLGEFLVLRRRKALLSSVNKASSTQQNDMTPPSSPAVSPATKLSAEATAREFASKNRKNSP